MKPFAFVLLFITQTNKTNTSIGPARRIRQIGRDELNGRNAPRPASPACARDPTRRVLQPRRDEQNGRDAPRFVSSARSRDRPCRVPQPRRDEINGRDAPRPVSTARARCVGQPGRDELNGRDAPRPASPARTHGPTRRAGQRDVDEALATQLTKSMENQVSKNTKTNETICFSVVVHHPNQ